MNIQDKIKSIRGFIEKDEIIKALNELKNILKNDEKLDDVIIQSAKKNRIEKQVRNGTVSFTDSELTNNQISKAILDIVREIEKYKIEHKIEKEIPLYHFELKVKPKSSGKRISWTKFLQGKIVETGRFGALFTIVLTDVVSDVYDYCFDLDANSQIIIKNGNDFTNPNFEFQIVSEHFKVNCKRILSFKKLLKNPLAAESGNNFEVILSIKSNSQKIAESICKRITTKYEFENL